MIEFEVNFVKSNFTKIESLLATKKYLLKLNIEFFYFHHCKFDDSEKNERYR